MLRGGDRNMVIDPLMNSSWMLWSNSHRQWDEYHYVQHFMQEKPLQYFRGISTQKKWLKIKNLHKGVFKAFIVGVSYESRLLSSSEDPQEPPPILAGLLEHADTHGEVVTYPRRWAAALKRCCHHLERFIRILSPMRRTKRRAFPSCVVPSLAGSRRRACIHGTSHVAHRHHPL